MNQIVPTPGLTKQLHGLSPQALAVIVCLAGAGVGAFLGSIDFPLGTVSGGICGLLAWGIWTPIMLKLAKKGCQRGRLVASGAGLGFIAGLMATDILYAILLASEPAPYWMGTEVVILVMLAASTCGGVGGAVTGALCGLLVPKRNYNRGQSPISEDRNG